MPFLLAEILDFQGSAHLIGVGSLSYLQISELPPVFQKYKQKYFPVYGRLSCEAA